MDSRKKPERKRVILKVEELEARSTPALVAPALSSLPNAKAAIYLNFVGGGVYSYGIPVPIRAFEGQTGTFTALQQAKMQQIWGYVKEDFAPFNINVTTVRPTSAFTQFVTIDIGLTGGQYSLIYGTGEFFVAPTVSSFGIAGAKGAISSNILTTPVQIGNLASEFAAVSLGVRYQSVFPVGVPKLPNPGFPQPFLTDGVIPIMGQFVSGSFTAYNALYVPPLFFVPGQFFAFPNIPLQARYYYYAYYYTNFVASQNRGLWWVGLNGQGVLQDDMAVIASNALVGFKRDDFGSTPQTAQFLNITSRAANNFAVNGLIGQAGDVDFFKFQARKGPISLQIRVPAPYNNLNPVVTLVAANQTTVLPATIVTGANGFDKLLTFNATYNGDYYLRISGQPTTPSATPRNRSIDEGTYTITGTILPYITSLTISPPLRWTYDAATGTYSGYISIVSTQNLPGAFSLQLTLPNAAMRAVLGNNVTLVSGPSFRLDIPTGLVANKPIQTFIAIKNPLNASLGTYYNSFTRFYLYL